MAAQYIDTNGLAALDSLAELQDEIKAKLSTLCRDFDANIATFHLWSKEEERLIFPVGEGKFRRLREFQDWLPSDHGPAANIFHDDKPVFAEDAENHPQFRGLFTFEEEIKSGAAFPLFGTEGEKFGIIFLNYRNGDDFMKLDRSTLQAKIDRVATEIEALLTERVWEGLRLQAGLRREQDALRHILDEVCSLLPHTEAIVWLAERKKGLVARAQSGCEGFSRPIIGAMVNPSKANFISQAYRSGKVQTAAVAQPTWPGDTTHEEGATKRQWQSGWAFPLANFGVLTIYTVGCGALEEFQQRIAQTLASQAQATIANHTQIRTLRAIGDVGSKLNAMLGASQRRKLLEAIVETACEVTGAEYVALLPYDPINKRDFLSVKEYGVRYPAEGTLEQPRSGGLSMHVLNDGRVVIEDTEDKENVHPFLVDTATFRELGIRALYGVLLKADNLCWGVLFFNYTQPHEFDRDHITTINLFASYAALALRNFGLLDDLRQSAKQLDTILKIIQSLASQGDLKVLLLRVASEARDIIKADSASVYQYDRDYKEFFRPIKLVPDDHPLPRPGGTAQAIVDQDEIIFADDAPTHPVVGKGTFIRERGVKSCMAAPLRVGDEPVGILFVNFWSTPHQFTEDEKRILKIIANQAAMAIQTAGRLHDTNRQFETVLKSIEVAKECDTLKALLKTYLEFALKEVGAECGTLQLPNPTAPNRLITRAWVGDVMRSEYLDSSIDQGITGRAVREKRLIYVPDTAKDPEHLKLFDGMRSILAMPLLFNASEGVLNAESSRPNAFDIYQRRLFQRFAEAAAVLVQERMEIEEAHKKEIEAEVDTAAAEMSRVVFHIVKNILGDVRTRIDDILEKDDSLTHEEDRRELTRANSRLLDSADVMKQLFQPYQSEPRIQVSPDDLVREALHLFGNKVDIEIMVNMPASLPKINVERQKTVHYFHELLRNGTEAIQRQLDEGRISHGLIEVAGRRKDNDEIELLFSNNGPRIPQDQWERIFLQFERTGYGRGAETHFGLGLWGARVVLKRQGGNIRVRESRDEKTVFEVILPISSGESERS